MQNNAEVIKTEQFEREFVKEFGKDYILLTKEAADNFKGVHAGYTKDELRIPLIVFDSKKSEVRLD